MDLRKKFGTDSRMEQDGVDIHMGADSYITIARAGGANANYERERQRAFRKHQRGGTISDMNLKEVEEIMQSIYARTVVLDWRGVELGSEQVTFTAENCLRVFREIPRVWEIV